MGRKRHRTASTAGFGYKIRDHIEGLETRVLLSRAIESAVAAPDTTGPRVIGSSIQQDDVLPVGDVSITVRFDEPIKTSNVDKSDFELANLARTVIVAASSFSLA